MKVNIHTCFQKITDQNQTRRNLVGLAGVKEQIIANLNGLESIFEHSLLAQLSLFDLGSVQIR